MPANDTRGLHSAHGNGYLVCVDVNSTHTTITRIDPAHGTARWTTEVAATPTLTDGTLCFVLEPATPSGTPPLPSNAGDIEPDGSVQFENDYTRDCLAIPDSSLANGVGAIQWTCNTNYDQQWIIENHDHGNTGQFTLKNRWSGKCLAIPNGTTTNGVQAIQWTCNGGSEQLWIHDSIGRLRNVASDRCLAVPNGSWKDGTEVIQWTCTTNTDQRWNALV
ncbi:RICIN domain-containing protein [Streptomyces sp. NPDC001165]|uniref:RICIN domain-containing protein n=1 Tax=Streptomyces sp. NPDC001165 TaxID=3364546 RepID=UPI00369A5639